MVYYKEKGWFRTLKTGLLKGQSPFCSSLSPCLCWKRWVCPPSRAVGQPQRKPGPTTTCRGEQPRPSHTCPRAKAAGAWLDHSLPRYLSCVLEVRSHPARVPRCAHGGDQALLGCWRGGLGAARGAGQPTGTGCFASSSKGQGALI